MSLAGDVAIVTGGGDGIGGATARRLAEEGASVLIVEVSKELGGMLHHRPGWIRGLRVFRFPRRTFSFSFSSSFLASIFR